MLKYVNVCYVSIREVVTKDIVKDLDVVLAAIAALEVRMLVCPQRVTSFCYVCWQRVYMFK